MGKNRDITGLTFGELKVIRPAKNTDGQQYWLCVCSCGREVVKQKRLIVKGAHPVCGNYHSRSIAVSHQKQVLKIRGNSKVLKIHHIWSQMKQRCFNPKRRGYAYKSSKGITVCPRWKKSFENFYIDMGERPDGAILGRIDINKDFSPDNCIWSTRKELAGIHALLS